MDKLYAVDACLGYMRPSTLVAIVADLEFHDNEIIDLTGDENTFYLKAKDALERVVGQKSASVLVDQELADM